MHLKPTFKLIFAALLVAAVLPLHSQVSPAATQGGMPSSLARDSPITVSIGDPAKEWKESSAWADWFPDRLPAALNGLGIEAEGHDIDFGRPAGIPRMRQDTGLGGLIYTWNRYRNFRPYIKYLAGVGSIDFAVTREHTPMTRFRSFRPAEESEYHAWRHIWIRGDYEYQFWHDVFGPHDLTPTGFTIGASYDFRPLASQQR